MFSNLIAGGALALVSAAVLAPSASFGGCCDSQKAEAKSTQAGKTQDDCCASAEAALTGDAVQCVMRPEPVNNAVPKVDYAGIRYGFCCAGCTGGFAKNADKLIAQAAKDKRTIGVALHDPSTGLRIEPKAAKAMLDHLGTRYYFADEAGRKSFEAHLEHFAPPKKEVLYCSVMGHGLPNYAAAGAYADHEGVRYYFCCADCLKTFRADPAKFAKASAGKVAAPKAVAAPKEKP